MKLIPPNILLLLVTVFSFGQEDWTLKKNGDSIKVFTRETNDLKLKEYKAITYVDTFKENVLSVILDAKNIKDWNYKTSESYLIKKEGDSIHHVYMYNDMPWPVSNRDFISKLTVKYPDEHSIKVLIEPGDSSLVPEKENVIRMKTFEGYWLIEEKNDLIKITQQLYGNPEGNLPSFFINTAIVSAPFNTFLKLREVLSK
ncbi:MAG: lipid-binding protein [Flavobacteriaceae bacterium]|nr:lipid-binding protein [Flavobacteriaceae bacterium]